MSLCNDHRRNVTPTQPGIYGNPDDCPWCAYERGVADTEARLSQRVLWQSCTRRGCGTTYSDGSARYCTACVQEMIAKTEARYKKLVEAAKSQHGNCDSSFEGCGIAQALRALESEGKRD